MDNKKLVMYKYTIDDIDIVYSNNKKEKIPLLNIGSINIEQDFDNDFFPVFNINASIPIEFKKRILADKNAKARVRISKVALKVSENNIDEKPKFMETFINDIFNIINTETDMDAQTVIQKESVEQSSKESNTNYNTEINLFLYKQEWLDINKNVDSVIFCDTDPMSAIVYLAKENKVKKMLVSNPDNKTKQNQIIIPETKFKTMVTNIENIYGVYNKGSVLFYGFNNLYYISKDIIKNLSRQTGEISLVNFNFEEFGTDKDRQPGSYIDKKNDRYFISCVDYPTFQDMSGYHKEILFNNIQYVNSKTGVTKSKSIDLNSNNGDTKIVVDDVYGNNYIIESKLYSVKEASLMAVLSLQQVDISYFTPNKRYMFNFNIKDFDRSRKYTGNYRLTKVVHLLSKNGSDKWFESKSMCNFNKA